jgi:hypothetical protein
VAPANRSDSSEGAPAEKVSQAAEDARATVGRTANEQRDAMADATQLALEAELVAQGMPKRRAVDIAAAVRAQALSLLNPAA